MSKDGVCSLLTDMVKEDKASSESLRLILVVFLGGCTFSEISALRFLGREKGESRVVWVLGTTCPAQEAFLLAVDHLYSLSGNCYSRRQGSTVCPAHI